MVAWLGDLDLKGYWGTFPIWFPNHKVKPNHPSRGQAVLIFLRLWGSPEPGGQHRREICAHEAALELWAPSCLGLPEKCNATQVENGGNSDTGCNTSFEHTQNKISGLLIFTLGPGGFPLGYRVEGRFGDVTVMHKN